MAPPFNFNIAFTLAVNTEAEEVALTAPELWQGIKRGGRNPNDFADYVSACDVLSGGRKEFRRRLTLADGAVHSPAGATLDQDVWISDHLSVRSQLSAECACFDAMRNGRGKTDRVSRL